MFPFLLSYRRIGSKNGSLFDFYLMQFAYIDLIYIILGISDRAAIYTNRMDKINHLVFWQEKRPIGNENDNAWLVDWSQSGCLNLVVQDSSNWQWRRRQQQGHQHRQYTHERRRRRRQQWHQCYIQTTEIHELVDMCSTVIYTQTLTRVHPHTSIKKIA